jgi:hypothetical protein
MTKRKKRKMREINLHHRNYSCGFMSASCIPKTYKKHQKRKDAYCER